MYEPHYTPKSDCEDCCNRCWNFYGNPHCEMCWNCDKTFRGIVYRLYYNKNGNHRIGRVRIVSDWLHTIR